MTGFSYRKGRRFEYAVKNRLEAEGSLVFRTAGSHGAADLIAVSPTTRVSFIQCKAKKPSAADWRKLKAMKETYGHTWILATPEEFTEL